MNKETVYIVAGPTATGKSALAVALAQQIDGEIISADSVQVYRGMNIGSAKPTTAEMSGIRHHMIDVVNPDEAYSVADFQAGALQCIEDILYRGKTPIVAGGTGLYIHSLTYQLDFSVAEGQDEELRRELDALDDDTLFALLISKDADAAGRIHPHNRKRVIRAIEVARNGRAGSYDFNKPNDAYDFKMIGLGCERELLYARIEERVDRMIQQGLVGEVRQLVEQYESCCVSMQAIGYKELLAYLDGACTLDEAVCNIKRNTRRFAKRQYTWFRRDQRIQWRNITEFESHNDLIGSINDGFYE